MNRASDDTQFDLKNAGPSDPISTNSPPPSRKIAPQSTKRTRPAVPAKDVTGELKRKRERSSKDEGRNDNKTRFQKPHIPRFPKEGTFAKADNGNRLQANGSVATKASHGKDGLEGSHDVSNSTRPQGHLLPLTAKDESPWKTYNKEYTIELGGLVNVAERKYPAHGQVGVKEFSGQDAESKLSRLRQIPEDFRNRYFVTCIEVFNFHNALHLITEYMTISLLHIVKAPRYPREKQVAAIIGQVDSSIPQHQAHAKEHRFSVESNTWNPKDWSMVTLPAPVFF